jgi:curved DNA-binding protein CbpA
MSDKPALTHRGRFATHPFAELIVEISQTGLSGSLRVSSGQRKAIVYFRSGRIVYVVSNAKSLKLFNLLLRRKKIDPADIARIPEFSNDVALAARLVAENRFSQEEIDEMFVEQMEEILIEVLTWADGEWEFDPTVRARSELEYPVSTAALLLDYGRCASAEHVSARFKSVEEAFARSENPPEHLMLLSHESFVLGMFESQPLKISDLRMRSAMPELGLLQALYILWLGGFLVRSGWNSAFPASKIGEIRTTHFVRTKRAAPIVAHSGISGTVEIESVANEPADAPEQTEETPLSLEDYLDRVEKAANHYEVLGLKVGADEKSIKEAYFSLAKQFHPDKYHRETPERSRRIQAAFTAIAHAYESLKTKESRAAYDLKLKREQEAKEMLKATGQDTVEAPKDRQAEEALENFQQGLLLLNEGDEEAAIVHLARAVHFSPQNALFQAHYGKALATDPRQKHKAESALQTAVRLDPKNFKIRTMLIEFFIANNMLKRAEGELNRYLDLVPSSMEARSMLGKLRSRTGEG